MINRRIDVEEERRLWFDTSATGAIPRASWLLDRQRKTGFLRMNRHYVMGVSKCTRGSFPEMCRL
jgi:hypothetical protein